MNKRKAEKNVQQKERQKKIKDIKKDQYYITQQRKKEDGNVKRENPNKEIERTFYGAIACSLRK